MKDGPKQTTAQHETQGVLIVIYWVLLVVAIVFEALGAAFMRLSAGRTRPLPLLLMLGSYAVGLSLLVYGLRQLKLSMVYAVWSGLGTALVGQIGMIWLREAATPIKLISLGLVVAGVGGLSLAGTH